MDSIFELDRATYKSIKNMDKATMQRFITNIYINAKANSEAYGIDYDKLKEDLSQIKGIGENRLNEIMAVIDKHISASRDNGD